MYALFVVLSEIEYVSEVIEKMRESGLRGATILESRGSREIVDDDLYTPSFLASIVETVEGRSKASRVVFSIVERKEQVENTMEELRKLLRIDTKNKRDIGMMFALPVTHMHGGELERHIKRRELKRREEEES